MQMRREDLRVLIDDLSDQEIVALWKVVAAMRQPEELTPQEAEQVDTALKEIEAGQFTRLDELKRAGRKW